MRRPVQPGQPILGVCHPNAIAVPQRNPWRQSGSIIRDFEHQRIAFPPSADLDPPGVGTVFHPVPDRVLRQRLEHEAGNHRVEQLGANVHCDREAVAEAHPHDVEVAGEESQLIPEQHLLRRGVAK